ncbi:MAG TPA: large conductance mechanosensitive channel protein MscL [Candidatus Dormibacteraeota bacterium]|nr:large conductance mechanosensitive channel protein MscL [Candidatus Dormibacteraeota bacterium]
MLKEFRTFLLRGNLVDLAVAVVVGVAFQAVITALVGDLITPVIAAVIGRPSFASLGFTINHATFRYGLFANAMLSFVVVAAVVFFVVVSPVNALMSRARRRPPDDPTTQRCPECLSTIPMGARRCAFCTAVLAAAPG